MRRRTWCSSRSASSRTSTCPALLGCRSKAAVSAYTKIPYFWSDQYDVNLEYRGHASGDDTAVWRGDREARSFSVFYLRDGLVEGVLSMNDSKTNEAGGKLVESRRRMDPSALEDTNRDLAELASTTT